MTSCPKEQECNSASCDFIEPLLERICASYSDSKGINHSDGYNLPRESEILRILDNLMELVFPGFGETEAYSPYALKFSVGETLARLNVELRDIILRAFRYNCSIEKCEACECPQKAADVSRLLLESIPDIRDAMKLDIQAAFDGDPAARTLDEIVLSYPGVKAITIQRLAHVLYHHKVPLIPRMICEYAHRITGIDIHPGAHLGRGVFIDHGTGVVIGETSEIGDNVKIYQGVTLGALSFPKDACGKIIKGAKRHPTIESGVTIYAGATILGAITIGKNSTIGGNVWLTDGTEPGARVTIAPPELTIRKPKVSPK